MNLGDLLKRNLAERLGSAGAGQVNSYTATQKCYRIKVEIYPQIVLFGDNSYERKHNKLSDQCRRRISPERI